MRTLFLSFLFFSVNAVAGLSVFDSNQFNKVIDINIQAEKEINENFRAMIDSIQASKDFKLNTEVHQLQDSSSN